jgi:hypothetical protein
MLILLGQFLCCCSCAHARIASSQHTSMPMLYAGSLKWSSESSMGGSSSVGPSAVRGEHDPEPVVVEISEAVGQLSDLLDDQVDGFGGSPVGGP